MTMQRTKGGLLVAALLCFACSEAAQAHAHETTRVVENEQSFLQSSGAQSLGRVTRTQWIGRAPMVVTSGVRVYVPARAGLSRESLEGLVRSDIGQARTGPLAVKGLSARVFSADAGYIVELSVPSPKDANELVREIEALLPPAAH